MCEHRGHHGHHGRRGHGRHGHHGHCAPVAHSGCCCGPGASSPGVPFARRFPTRDERIAQLEAYLQELEGEAEAVKERIAALEAAD